MCININSYFQGRLLLVEDNPFKDFPEFSEVMDNISRDGFQVHYRSMRVLYADDGVRWRRKWEPLILKWKRLAETWIKIIGIIRNNGLDDLTTIRKIVNSVSDVEVTEFFNRIHNNILTLREIEGLKRYLLTKSKSESRLVRDFIEHNLEQYGYYNERAILFSENQSVVFKDSVLDFLSCMEKTEPMVNVGGIKMIPYEDFKYCVYSLKEIIESADFKAY